MSLLGLPILLAIFAAFCLSIWGLFSHGRSIFCALGGGLMAAGAVLGAVYAWKESQSLTWTAVYLAICGIGLASAIRQAKNSPPSLDESSD